MSKYAKICERLRELLDRMQPGERLPSIRGLMLRFGVSQATVDRSLTLLEESGEVRRRPCVGYYRSVTGEHRRKIMFCFCYRAEHLSNPLYGSVLSEFLRHTEAQHFDVSVMSFDENEPISSLRQKIEGNGVRFCVMLGSSRVTSHHALKEMNVRSVQFYPNYIPEEGEAILIDNAGILHQLMELLTEQGHTRISMFHGQHFENTYMLDQEERMEAFYREMHSRGLPLSARSMVYGGFDADAGYTAARKVLDIPTGLRPTAIVANDYNIAGIYHAARELGLRIPEDLSVTGIDNLPLSTSLSPQVTTVDIKWHTALAMALHHITNPLDKGSLHRVPVELIPRASVAPPPCA